MSITDAVVPFHIKDAPILKYACDSLKYIIGVKNIYVIGNENPNIEETFFINEKDILNLISIKEIKKTWDSKNKNISNRTGWLYQQFLKLGAPDYISNLSDTFLISDSDIIFVNNPYDNQETSTFPYAKAYTNEYHAPYREQYARLLKEECSAGFSFINHHMVFNKKYLWLLKNEIEMIHKKRWDLSILDTLDYNESSNFSEYDLYGNWMIKNHKNVCRETHFNIVDYAKIPSVDDLMECKSKNIHIVSSQAYRRQF